MNANGKYLKVWKKKEQNGYTKLDLGDSKKNKDGSYLNWTWFDCLVVGNAASVQVEEQDTIEVTSSQISQEKYQDKWYTRIVIFEMNVMSSGNVNKPEPQRDEYKGQDDFQGFQAMDSDSDLPF